MDNFDTLYLEHLNEMAQSHPIDGFSEQDVDRILNRILCFLPNEGKLYKYRSPEGNAFFNAYDSLKNGYIWLSDASSFNDNLDSIINYDFDSEKSNISNYLKENPYLLFLHAVDLDVRILDLDESQQIMFNRIIRCYDIKSGVIDKEKAVKELQLYGWTEDEVVATINKFDDFVRTFFDKNPGVINQIIDNLLNSNKIIRESIRVYSMCDTYDSDTMWGYYSHNNGFCVEYDFNKVRSLRLDLKRLLISIYKVDYQENHDTYSFFDAVKQMLNQHSLSAQDNRKFVTQIITKGKQWEYEKEWRLVLFHVDNKLMADLVSALYIDEKMLHSESGKILVELAKKRNWNIYVRKLNSSQTKTIFEKSFF